MGNKNMNSVDYYEGEETANMEDEFNNRVSNISNPNPGGKVFCAKHPEKEIEYFCKICHSIVCPKCMFIEHNGHELA